MRKKPLSALCKISNGFAFKSDDYASYGHRVIRITNVQKGLIVDSDPKFIPNEVADKAYNFKLKPDDILVSLTGNVGRVGRVFLQHLPAVLNQRVGLIRSTSSEINDKYLFQFLNSDKFEREAIQNSNGVAQLNLSTKWIESYEVPLPPLDDQIRIAHLLGKAEGLIAQRKQHLQQLDELLKSVFLEMFGDPVQNEKGWETGTSLIYAEMVTVGVVVKPASHYVEHGVIALRSLNVRPNHIDLSDLVYFSQESNDSVLLKSRLKTNDIVVVRTGKTGTAAVIPAALDGANCIDLIIVRPKRTIINPQFLTHLLNSERGTALVSSLEVGGIQRHFNVGALNKIPFPLPPLDLQERFADIAEKVETLKFRYQQSLTDIETLYAALSQSAFQGELDLSHIPLPAVTLEPEPMESGSTLTAELDVPNSPLPNLGLDVVELADEAKRLTLPTAWLEVWSTAHTGQAFVLSDFLDAAQARLAELYPEDELELGMAAYEHIKNWVYTALDSGALTQSYDEANKRITLTITRA